MQSPERIIRPSTLSDRIPVITPQQSVLIVQALQQVGLLDAEGWVVQDPKDYNRKGSKVYGWTRAVYELLPWMANSHSLNLNLRTSLIFQELTAADARHESMHGARPRRAARRAAATAAWRHCMQRPRVWRLAAQQVWTAAKQLSLKIASSRHSTAAPPRRLRHRMPGVAGVWGHGQPHPPGQHLQEDAAVAAQHDSKLCAATRPGKVRSCHPAAP